MPENSIDKFFELTMEDRQDASYAACLAGTTITGMAMGRLGGLGGLGIGAAGGLLWGLLTCKKLAPVIERKLFSSAETLSEGELLSLLGVIRAETGVKTKSDALYLLSQVRSVALATGEKSLETQGVDVPPRVAAAQLLRNRTRPSA